ncbi:hypothetical protein MJO28_002822 [Puccinia striiformis f. sp. tritici]|uniref:Uncharacterized protein n=1 Tax=Puccinia striiformis f. sp. tritici TaxID=168172 RepID=A0ACC0ESN8_9BASI|nr:hypothetical protein MJO28_002822 [Puccinia striiformis f. sp. tritici]
MTSTPNLKRACPFTVLYTKPQTPAFPLIHDIYEVVPLPWTQVVPAPADIYVHPNALRLVRKIGGTLPAFPANPYLFTIPGNTRDDAETFVTAMQATIYWTKHRETKNQHATITPGVVNKGGRPPEFHFKLEFQCPRSGIHIVKPNSRKSAPSQKCDCKSWFSISHHVKTDSLRVVWRWDHNHDPYSEDEVSTMRTPKVIANWINERVMSGLGWASIEKLLSCPDLFSMEVDAAIPEAHYVAYDQVRYLIRKQIRVLSKKDDNVIKSISLWNNQLISEGFNTYFPTSTSGTGFIFAFQSDWQKNMLIKHGASMLMLDATHNTVSNYAFDGKLKASSYTFLIRDPIIGKGLPVCWAFTLSLATEPLSQILTWLHDSTGYTPLAVMSDCALAIRNAVRGVYRNMESPPKHYWCLFHVLKAFTANANMHLAERSAEALADFYRLVYEDNINPELSWPLMAAKWSLVSPVFVAYVEQQWIANIQHWSMYYRITTHQGIHTNNYTESWHRILKYKFIPQTERRRMDELVHILKSDVLGYYMRQSARVLHGIQKQSVNQFQLNAKMAAKSYTPDHLTTLGVHIIQHSDQVGFPCSDQAMHVAPFTDSYTLPQFTINSFTNPLSAVYFVSYEQTATARKSRITRCSCPHFERYGSACKHMFYLAMIYNMLVVEATNLSNGPHMTLEEILTLIGDQPTELGPARYDPEGTPRASNFPHHRSVSSLTVPPGSSALPLTTDRLRGTRSSVDLTLSDDESEESDVEIVATGFSAGAPSTVASQSSGHGTVPPQSSGRGTVTPQLSGPETTSGGPLTRPVAPQMSGRDISKLTNKQHQKHIKNLQASGLRALKQVEALLKAPKNRNTFATSATTDTMEQFQKGAQEILGLVKESLGLSDSQIR